MKMSLKRLPYLMASLLIASAGSLTAPAVSTADEYEWDPSSGYHEEEWYDPSDWGSDDGQISYENDYFGDYYDIDDEDVGDANTDYGEPWYGNNYYNDEWYNDEAGFDNWYDDGDDDLNIDEGAYGVDEYEEAGN